ncbi:MAG: DinB family protein [Chloroflexi bacterium]|nr:DinB family protein [Chloroflexota bacterium]MDA1146091.1 DinB family protein [Chloroflexota bacterium]
MPTADDRHQALTTARLKLREALTAVGDRWEVADDDGWTPRRAAEHCIERDTGLAGIAVAAMRGEPAAEKYTQTGDPNVPARLSLASSAEAVSALDSGGALVDSTIANASDADLVRPADLNAGELPNTLDAVLAHATWHLNDHADQIAKMS